VTGLNFTALGITPRTDTSVPVTEVFDAIRNLTQLQSLVLCGGFLSGQLETEQQPGLETLQDLRHLDISNNPGISGSLPSSWYALAALQTLDVSNTGVSGSLPAVYAALQQLREFRAVNCSGLSGQLPPAWGLLNLEVLEVTNSALSGTLPRAWADTAALRQAAATAASSVSAGSHSDPLSPQRNTASDAVVQALGQAAALGGLQQLRVLDLSASDAIIGSMYGPLPDSFATFGQLQVSSNTSICTDRERGQTALFVWRTATTAPNTFWKWQLSAAAAGDNASDISNSGC
jgi:hypothetical protein